MSKDNPYVMGPDFPLLEKLSPSSFQLELPQLSKTPTPTRNAPLPLPLPAEPTTAEEFSKRLEVGGDLHQTIKLCGTIDWPTHHGRIDKIRTPSLHPMAITEVVDALAAEVSVSRRSWQPGVYLYAIAPGDAYTIMRATPDSEAPWTPTIADLAAKDWFIIEFVL